MPNGRGRALCWVGVEVGAQGAGGEAHLEPPVPGSEANADAGRPGRAEAARCQAACCKWQTRSGCRSEGVTWGLLLLTLSHALLQVREGEGAWVRGPHHEVRVLKREGGRKPGHQPRVNRQPRRQSPASCGVARNRMRATQAENQARRVSRWEAGEAQQPAQRRPWRGDMPPGRVARHGAQCDGPSDGHSRAECL